MKATYFTAVALLLAGYAQGSTVGAFNTTAFENEGVIRFWFWRDGDTDVVQSVDYVTQDLGAHAGVHYLARTGTVTFAIGQTSVPVDVALIDNGLLDGPKSFELVAGNPSPGMTVAQNDGWSCSPSFWVGTIEDNELPPTRVDPLFVPDTGPGYNPTLGASWAAPMPDGRVLVAGGSNGVTMLQSNGWVDPAFRPGDAHVPGPFDPLHVFADGKILTRQQMTYPQQRFVRLLPSGAVDAAFPICVETWPSNLCPRFVAAQADGKIFVYSRSGWLSNNAVYWDSGILRRLNPDGTVDMGFNQGIPTEDIGEHIAAVAVQPDDKILVGGYRPPNEATRSKLVRLNPDGSPDNTFIRFEGSIRKVLARANGKILVAFGDMTGHDRLLQLNGDGSLDPSFTAAPEAVGLESWIEQPDGRLLIQRWWYRNVIRLNIDGSLDHTFTLDVHLLPDGCEGYSAGDAEVALTASGQILVGGRFDRVDGFARPGLVRLMDATPERDVRVLTPAEFCRSNGVARVQVVRTGATTNEASVFFSTSPATARAGVDYVAQSGTLHFSPLEVSKEVTIPLLAGTGAVERLTFKLELRNPSAGYTNAVPTPIVILPDLRIAAERLFGLRAAGSSNGSPVFTVFGSPGATYALEFTESLDAPDGWTDAATFTLTNSTQTVIDGFNIWDNEMQFYRLRRVAP